MTRYVSLCVSSSLCLGLAAHAPATTITDDFGTAHDYLADGVTGTVWDGLLNGGSAVTLDANTTNAGALSVGLGSAKMGWSSTDGVYNAPFLYMDVSDGNDFTVQATTVAATYGDWNVMGLMVYKDNSNFVGVNANYFQPPRTDDIEVAGRSVVGGVETTTSSSEAAWYGDVPVYLKLSYTADTQTFNYWTSTDGTNWNAGLWTGSTTDLVLEDMTGDLKVGVQFSGYAADAPGRVGQFDNFSLTVVPEPGTVALLAAGLLGLLAYAWRKRR